MRSVPANGFRGLQPGFSIQAHTPLVYTAHAELDMHGCMAVRFVAGGGQPSAHISQVNKGENVEHLPTSHTCVNQLCIPPYGSKEVWAPRLASHASHAPFLAPRP